MSEHPSHSTAPEPPPSVAFQTEAGVLCARCAATPAEREFPLAPVDLDKVAHLSSIVCGRCDRLWVGQGWLGRGQVVELADGRIVSLEPLQPFGDLGKLESETWRDSGAPESDSTAAPHSAPHSYMDFSYSTGDPLEIATRFRRDQAARAAADADHVVDLEKVRRNLEHGIPGERRPRKSADNIFEAPISVPLAPGDVLADDCEFHLPGGKVLGRQGAKASVDSIATSFVADDVERDASTYSMSFTRPNEIEIRFDRPKPGTVRRRRYVMTGEFLASMLAPGPHRDGYEVVGGGIPYDAVLVDSRYETPTFSAWFVLEHSSFDPVPEGAAYPDVDLSLRRIEPAPPIQVDSIEVKPGTLLVVRSERPLGPEAREQIGRALRSTGVGSGTMQGLFLGDGVSIESLDEEAMLRAGWVRAR